jgi:hypothetical protein
MSRAQAFEVFLYGVALGVNLAAALVQFLASRKRGTRS